MNKATLVRVTLVLAIGGVAIGAYPFYASLSPSAASGSLLQRVDLSSLAPGDHLVVDAALEVTGRHANFRDSYLILRDLHGPIRVFALPRQDGKYILPDVGWARPAAWCENLGPELANGKLKPGGGITCHDAGFGQWGSDEWRWDYAGRNLGRSTADLPVPEFSLEGTELVLGKRQAR